MAIKKKNLRKALFYIILKRLNTNGKKSIRKQAWAKALFQERANNGAFHQTLQNIRVLDREAHFSYMITQT